MRLDLGAGGRPREGFLGVDVVQVTPETCRFDLICGSQWPWPDSSVDELASSHFIEHIPADYVEVMKRVPNGGSFNILRAQQDRLLFFFDQAFRVIKPGGLFHLTWPALKSTDAFRDPTHRRFIPLEMLHYLSTSGRAAMGLEHYEATCNWVTLGDSLIHCESSVPVDDAHDAINRHWDVQKAFTVTLQAEK